MEILFNAMLIDLLLLSISGSYEESFSLLIPSYHEFSHDIL